MSLNFLNSFGKPILRKIIIYLIRRSSKILLKKLRAKNMTIKKYNFKSISNYDDDDRGEINNNESLTDVSDYVPTVDLINKFLSGDIRQRHNLYYDDDDDLDTPPDLTEQRGVDISDVYNMAETLKQNQEKQTTAKMETTTQAETKETTTTDGDGNVVNETVLEK